MWLVAHIGVQIVGAEQHARRRVRVLLPARDEVRHLALARVRVQIPRHGEVDAVDEDVARAKELAATRSTACAL